jgi:hypothetical protein
MSPNNLMILNRPHSRIKKTSFSAIRPASSKRRRVVRPVIACTAPDYAQGRHRRHKTFCTLAKDT